MNYKESKEILKEIKKAKRILLNCHRDPDPDSIGSALGLYKVLAKMGKSVDVACPTKSLDSSVDYLSNYKKIKHINYSSLDFSQYDLFITLDSSSWDMVTNDKSVSIPDMKIIAIDHHDSNDGYGTINLVDKKSISVGEMLFGLFDDWKVEIDENTATALMAAIIGDSGAFRYPNTSSKTLKVASELMKLGADKDLAIHRIYRSENVNMLRFWGEALQRLKHDKKHKFIWTAIPYSINEKYEKLVGKRETTASNFAQIVDGTEFGFVAIEHDLGMLSISFRSRTGFDTSKIAQALGGGGHIYASGAKIEAPFDEAVEKVLKTARKFAINNTSNKY